MEKAILADKKNPLPMYQKANILVSLENFDEALQVLEELKEYIPSESSVFALMGNIYKRRNMHEKAMLHFGLALDLKPPATDVAAIKVIGLSSALFLKYTYQKKVIDLFHSYLIACKIGYYY
jgi:anaphase-promoting complex subunit 3